jgi:cytochrome c556
MSTKRWFLRRVVLGISIGSVVLIAGTDDQAAQAQQAADVQQRIQLAPTERDAIRREMRTMERSLNLILHGLTDGNLQMVEKAARTSGKAIAIGPQLEKKLPSQYAALDQKVHVRFEQLADATKGGTIQGDVVPRLAAITGYCVACHDMFRVDETR